MGGILLKLVRQTESGMAEVEADTIAKSCLDLFKKEGIDRDEVVDDLLEGVGVAELQQKYCIDISSRYVPTHPPTHPPTHVSHPSQPTHPPTHLFQQVRQNRSFLHGEGDPQRPCFQGPFVHPPTHISLSFSYPPTYPPIHQSFSHPPPSLFLFNNR